MVWGGGSCHLPFCWFKLNGMKAKLSVIVDEVRGKAGTVVGKMSSAGQILMMRSVGRDPKSSSQMRSRMLLSALAQRWKGLAQGQRDLWNSNARGSMTGYSLFCERNTNLNSIGRSFIDDFIDDQPLPSYYQFKSKSDLAHREFIIKLSSVEIVDNVKFIIKVSQFTKRLLTNDGYKLRNIAVLSATPNSYVNIYDDVIRVFGTVPADESWFRIGIAPISMIAGNAGMFVGMSTQWTDKVPPFVPEVSITLDPNDCNFNATQDYGECLVKGNFFNFTKDINSTIEGFFEIYNDREMTNTFYMSGRSDVILETGTIMFTREMDGGEFSTPWLKGEAKFVRVGLNIIVVDERKTYTFYTNLVEIVAS